MSEVLDYLHYYSSPLGQITLSSDGEYITGLWFDGQKYYMSGIRPDGAGECFLPVFAMTDEWLNIYFSGNNPEFTPPVRLRGTEYRRAVWKALMAVPYGSTVTYGELASDVSKHMINGKTSARAVGGAVGHNPVSIIVPCHRVIGACGALTGYAGGIGRKKELLMLEKKK